MKRAELHRKINAMLDAFYVNTKRASKAKTVVEKLRAIDQAKRALKRTQRLMAQLDKIELSRRATRK